MIKQKPVGEHKIDIYIEELNIAVEYDEAQHFTFTNQVKDSIRQKELEDKLHCTFLRCNFNDTDAYNIGLVIKEIIHKTYKNIA